MATVVNDPNAHAASASARKVQPALEWPNAKAQFTSALNLISGTLAIGVLLVPEIFSPDESGGIAFVARHRVLATVILVLFFLSPWIRIGVRRASRYGMLYQSSEKIIAALDETRDRVSTLEESAIREKDQIIGYQDRVAMQFHAMDQLRRIVDKQGETLVQHKKVNALLISVIRLLDRFEIRAIVRDDDSYLLLTDAYGDAVTLDDQFCLVDLNLPDLIGIAFPEKANPEGYWLLKPEIVFDEDWWKSMQRDAHQRKKYNSTVIAIRVREQVGE